ncbi:MAG: hypothetical protein K0R08_284 [Solimicrobium sp.]|jgi:hypothetical protein|nr:hypothetical protein [Solimicrobium sp.]
MKFLSSLLIAPTFKENDSKSHVSNIAVGGRERKEEGGKIISFIIRTGEQITYLGKNDVITDRIPTRNRTEEAVYIQRDGEVRRAEYS